MLSMRKLAPDQIELIDAFLAEGLSEKVSPALLEKDIHVTDALISIMAIEHAHTDFAFCGGTSLSKAHRLIARMSEDVDIKVILADVHRLTTSAQKRHLSLLKNKAATGLGGTPKFRHSGFLQ